MGKSNSGVVLFTYVSANNKKYLQKLSLKTNQPLSRCLDAILDSLRLKRAINLPTKVPKAVAKFELVKANKQKKIDTLEAQC